jgi:16S rRNA (adenine1518-N6/adenine1519-N6)-dimethyltransferase
MESISALFKEFSYRPRKSQGQNFLTDAYILDRIEQVVECPPGDVLLEVGGGYGNLTERLVRKNAPLTVVEPDHKLFAMLERKFGETAGSTMELAQPDRGPRLETSPFAEASGDRSAQASGINLVKTDILKLDLASLAPPPPARLTVAGNIPYYLTTPLITRLLTQYPTILRRVYLMVQKEVAERLAAMPGTKAYGALTLCAQYYSRARKILDVPSRCFRPRPKVDSAFIELEIKESLPLSGEPERRFFSLVRAIFQSRRKMLSNSLKSLGRPPEKVQEALLKTGIDPQVRGEQLGLEKLIELSQALE